MQLDDRFLFQGMRVRPIWKNSYIIKLQTGRFYVFPDNVIHLNTTKGAKSGTKMQFCEYRQKSDYIRISQHLFAVTQTFRKHDALSLLTQHPLHPD